MARKDGGKCSADVLEGSYFMARLMVVIGLMASVLALSGLFHSGLRRLGQPSIISHILAGVVVGPTVLGRMVNLRQLGMEDTGMALDDAIYYLRVVFMFFTGLEMDLCYLRRYLRASLVLASGGSVLCLLLAAVAGPFFYGLLHPGKETFYTDGIYASTALFMLVLTSTASPVLIRIVTELKLTGSETGQLAIGTAFANDIASLVAVSIMDVDWTTYDKDGKARPDNLLGQPMAKLIIFLFLSLNVWIAIRVVVWLVRLLNRVKKGRQYISMYVLCAMLLFIVNTAQRLYVFGYSASMTAFLIGLATPRDGPTARTLIDQLTYPVHQIIMPLCFGVTGARLDFTKIGDFTPTHLIIVVAFTTLLGTTGRVAGTVAAGRMIGIPAQETLVLGLLLNVKGYADILAINLGDKAGIWGDATQSVLLLSSIINTLMAGPASAAIVRQQRRAFQYRSHCLQDLKLDEELRVLVCVHGARSVHAMLTLAEISKGTTPVAIYLLHLIELMTAHKYAITHLYHPKGGARDDNGRWGHTREIDQVVAAVDRFTNDTIVTVRQMTAISNLASMDTDVCNGVEDTRASLVIVPFHKEQRYDRRMVCRREGRRELNQRILQRAPCTVGVLVERRLGSIGERQSTAEGNQSGSVDPEAEGSAPAHDVVAVFLGGPDDREAVAYATRLAAHPSVSVTVSRFLPEGASMDATTEARPTMPMSANDSGGDGDHVTVMVEGMADEEFMAEFYARFVEPGHVSYTEMYVRNGVGVVESLWSMVGMYSLFIVGKGGGGSGGAAAEMTKGMGGLNEECPELGPIGDFLSSDDLLGYGASVLVLRHHNVQKKTRGTQ